MNGRLLFALRVIGFTTSKIAQPGMSITCLALFERIYMILRLALIELKRLATRPRYLAMFLLLAIFGIGLMIFSTSDLYQAPDAGGVWSAWSALLKVGLPIYLLIPLFIGFTAGASLAEDRSTGYQQFLQMRLSSRKRFIVGKTIGMLAAAFFGAVACLILMSIFAFSFFPISPIDSNIATFDKNIFMQSPYLYLGLVAITVGLGAGAISGVASLASIIINNPYSAGAAPIGFLLCSIALESITKSAYLEIFPMLALSRQGFTFSYLILAWSLYNLFFYGLTVIFFENKPHLVKTGAHK